MGIITSDDDYYHLQAEFNDGMERATSADMLLLHDVLIHQHRIIQCAQVEVTPIGASGKTRVQTTFADGRYFRDVVRVVDGVQLLDTSTNGSFKIDEYKAMRPTREHLFHIMLAHGLINLLVTFH